METEMMLDKHFEDQEIKRDMEAPTEMVHIRVQ